MNAKHDRPRRRAAAGLLVAAALTGCAGGFHRSPGGAEGGERAGAHRWSRAVVAQGVDGATAGESVDVDASGRVVVVAGVQGRADFGPRELLGRASITGPGAPTENRYALVLYDPGGRPLWARETVTDCGALTSAPSARFDDAGAIVLAGGTLPELEICVIGVSATGELRWARRLPGTEGTPRLAVGPGGRAVIAGRWRQGPTTSHVELLDRAGETRWTFDLEAQISAVAFSSGGRVILAGRLLGDITFGETEVPVGRLGPIFAAALSAEGEPLWIWAFPAEAEASLQMDADELGVVLALGMASSDPTRGAALGEPAPEPRPLVLRLDGEGQPLWATPLEGEQVVTALSSSRSGQLALAISQPPPNAHPEGGCEPRALLRFDRQGVLVGTSLLANRRCSTARACADSRLSVDDVALDDQGGLAITGALAGELDLGGGPLRTRARRVTAREGQAGCEPGEAMIESSWAMFVGRFSI